MAYVAVKGGERAIEASLELIGNRRLRGGRVLDVRDLRAGMSALLDQVMSEASLYGEEAAALAVKQAEGSPEEAVFLLRAFRSTLPRAHYSSVIRTSEMFVERRISSAFKDIPGYQVPFASREMPIARGWGTGGLQLTLSLVGRSDVVKVIDQGADESVNAVNIKKFIAVTAGLATTEDPARATIIQSRHRIPELPLREGQILVLQVPIPEPLRFTEPSELATRKLHAEKEYSGAYLMLFEEIMKYGVLGGGRGPSRGGERPLRHGPQPHPPLRQPQA